MGPEGEGDTEQQVDEEEQAEQAVLATPKVLTTPIRVLVANISGMLPRPLTSLIEQQPDMVLVGQVNDPVELLLAMSIGKESENEADVLILLASRVDPPPGICSHLLSEFPSLKMLVLSTSGDAAVAYWMGMLQQRLPMGASTSLLANIRSVYTMPAS